jgi:DNA-binding PadR family transcriptional regulator
MFDIMTDASRLGEVEHLVLLAVLRLEGEAYAVPIRDLILTEAGIALPRGSIYVTLDRLEEKGLVESWFSEPTAEPGGKARRLFRAKPAGVSALRAAQRGFDRLSTGTVVARERRGRA